MTICCSQLILCAVGRKKFWMMDNGKILATLAIIMIGKQEKDESGRVLFLTFETKNGKSEISEDREFGERRCHFE